METHIIAVVILIFFGFYLGSKWGKYEKNQGEQIVNNLLEKCFSNETCHLLKNVTIPTADGTTQIDHIIVSTKGIFVIETKAFSGWIFGDKKLSVWTKTTRQGRKYPFQNPLHQNYKHIKELELYFDFLPNNSLKSIVVFVGGAEFKTEMPENVLHLDNLVQYIKQFDNNVLSLNRVYFIVGKLEFFRKEVSAKTDKEHKEYLEKKFGSKTN